MNVLFLYSEVIDPQKGGVEKVTDIIADFLEKEGVGVFYLCLHKSRNNVNSKRQLFLPVQKSFFNKRNYSELYNIIKTKNINYIINQGALFRETANFSYLAIKLGIPIISVIHNSALSIIDNYNIIYNKNSVIGRIITICYKFKSIKNLIRNIYVKKHRPHYQKLLEKSASVVLLSDKYKEEFRILSGRQNLGNVLSIANPITLNHIESLKENRVLYVGRINKAQKQINRLLTIWQRIEEKFPHWALDVVGDGEDLNDLKLEFKDLKNVNFHGFQNPIVYYKRAKLFCMTSSFEGLPMTLIEAQSFGVVPIAFNTFKSATDIIDNESNGYLVCPYDEDEYFHKICNLIESPELLQSMQIKAKEQSKKFDINNIGRMWISLLKKI